MDQPAAKKRRLAPKIEAQASPPHPPPFPHEPAPPAQLYQVQEAPPPPPERHEFESFARHLQDAAMLIYRQTQKSPYTKTYVLILRWEEDNAVEHDLAALDQVLCDRYNYRTERFNIPTGLNASVKLGVRMASFLEHAAPDHLLIIYYAGYGYVDTDNQLYWASNPEGDSKLRWSGVRCLFEDVQSDMLLLLDTCAAKEEPIPEGSSVKQIIAANSPEHYSRDHGLRSFTSYVTEALAKFSGGRPFNSERLYHEVAIQRQQELIQASGLTNGASKSIALTEKLPVLYALSSIKGQVISISPLPSHAEMQLRSPQAGIDGDAQLLRTSREDPIIHPNAVADLTFDEPRVLVCTTFVGEASPDMSSFNHWLHNAPAIASKIAVEGMFLGPPTMLLISMPVPVWNVVQHDKVCCFLGYVNSHNMTHLYNRLVGSVSVNKASAKDVEDGRMLLEAREVAASTPVVRRHELPSHSQLRPETPIRLESMSRLDPMTLPQPSGTPGMAYASSRPGTAIAKNDVEDSAEMQEAAEQLKALSHVRPLSRDNISAAHVQATPTENTTTTRRDEVSPHEANESGADETLYNPEFTPPSARPKQQRRSLQKQAPKQETRCNHCSHAPFKDYSSLRKHIAAAHTRPFPCAFAFAGCTSTFGSKNEWKRHIASQHLCLQYYRCSSCPQSTVEGKGNEFNRKDLFTQHLRRMHAPFAIKKALAKGDSKLQLDWETHVKDMQQTCLVTRRQPPQRSSCPKSDCASVFEGPTSWDEWTEHVGRHMEKGEAGRLSVDRLLAKWALEEGIIERRDDGEYRLCSGSNNNPERESAGNNLEYQSDGNKRDKDRDKDRDRDRDRDQEQDRDQEDRTIIAASTMVDKMDVDE
ncbi:hypothetical protein F4813DRAFT_87347 [Daldinia decipiens]|uniref:uncharacterized protein n=1 Tax=Daldinia decipiens TaxID=326647 RepID=UPI0020C4E569|nr:uncharacterized protein F4813DRAFT_87347 [Daldinia decipiens]KAI1657372.1 hypothetical protein F4813DRAFT_87347 [Daldinia decipiens]